MLFSKPWSVWRASKRHPVCLVLLLGMATTAQACIQYTCRLLRSYGIDNLTPEIIRQAKFNTPTVYAPLIKALHDLALCVAAGLPRGCGQGMAQLKLQLTQEMVDVDTIAPEGKLLLLHYLSSWGCPAGLLAQLAVPSPSSTSSSSSSSGGSSRLCLLALAWLIGHGRLFERALDFLQLPGDLLPLLPPYPEDTSLTAAAQARYAAAFAAAQQHAQRVQQQLQSLAGSSNSKAGAASSSSSSSSAWPAVQAAAHHLLSTYRAATLRLQLLTSLQEGKEKLLHQIQQQQQQQGAASSSRNGSSSISCSHHQGGRNAIPAAANTAGGKTPMLTAFELHLLSNPLLLQQHEDALLRACNLLQQQLQCVQAANMFFAWAASVLQEEQKAAAAATAAGSPQLSGRPLPSVDDVLPLLQQLPAAGSPEAPVLLQHIMKQLRQAAAAAGYDVQSAAHDLTGSNPTGSSSSSSTAVTGGADTAPCAAQLAGLSLRPPGSTAAAAAAAAAVGAAGSPGSCVPGIAVDQQAALLPFFRVAAAALAQVGLKAGHDQQLPDLPNDIQQRLQALQQQQHEPQRQQQQLPLQSNHVWHRLALTPEQLSALHTRWHQQQQQQQQQQESPPARQPADAATTEALSLADAVLWDVSRQHPGKLVPVAAELQRLQEMAMQVAKQLAKTRASNKQQLQAAEELLIAAAGDDENLMFLHR